MKTFRLFAPLGLPLLLAACGGGTEEPDTGMMGDTMGMDTMAASPMPMPADTGMGMGTGNTVALEPLNDSGASGEATISDAGGQTEVMVRLTGAPQGERPGHIHMGTCDSIGEVVQPLQSVTVGADGTGTSTSTVAIDPATVMDGQHVVSFHGEGGQPIVCGAIPMHQM